MEGNFRYTIPMIRAIEQYINEDEITFTHKYTDNVVTDLMSVAEFKADFYIALKEIGIVKYKEKLTYDQVERMVKILNGEADYTR